MKIQICGSMTFAKEMVEIKKELESKGHEVGLPFETELHLKKAELVDDLDSNLHYCIKNDVMGKGFNFVAAADAILVLNHPRKGVHGYIGTSTQMEIAVAYYLKKKIFLLHHIPHFDEARWAFEIAIMNPTVLEGDLEKII